GKSHRNADAMSRPPIAASVVVKMEPEENGFDLDQLKKDPKVNEILNRLQDPQDFEIRDQFVLDGNVLKKFWRPVSGKRDELKILVVVPPAEREELMKRFHDSIVGGHQGFK